MEVFKTIATLHDDEFTFVAWGASQTEAAADRKEFKSNLGEGYNITSQTVNIPTAKGPLVAWLNKNVKT